VIDEKTQATLSQIGREEKAAAADKLSPIVRHRASMAQPKLMGFAEPVIGPATSGRTRWLNPSYGLNFGHPTTRRWGPHHKLESRPNLPFNGFFNGL
jgi:hypothetical protein